jgi:predicted ATPase
MKVISSAELRNNMKKYLDTARMETVIIQRGKNETFVLTRQDDLPEDFNRAISMDEAILRVEAGMRKIIERHKQIEDSK